MSQIRALRLLCTRYVTGINLAFQCSGSIRPIKKMFLVPAHFIFGVGIFLLLLAVVVVVVVVVLLLLLLLLLLLSSLT